jgi:hypothetical protein
MEPEELSKIAVRRAGEAAQRLIAEAAARLGIDLAADDQLGFRIMSDFAGRMYATGSRDAMAETTAQFIEQLPPNVNVTIGSVTVVPEGSLGDFDPVWYREP